MKSYLQPVHKHELLINYLMKSRKPLHNLSSTAQTPKSLIKLKEHTEAANSVIWR